MGYSTSNILPPTSIRDVIALISILNCLPRTINAIILIFYTLSGSTKLIGGKLFSKAFSIGNKEFNSNSFESNAIDYPRMTMTIMQLISIGSIISLATISLSSYKLLYYIDLIAKTILAMDWIGSSNTHQTSFISSIPTNSPQDSFSDLFYMVSNDNFVKFICCYLAVLFIEYLKNNINFNALANLLMVQDFNRLFSHEIFQTVTHDNNHSSANVHNISGIFKFLNRNIIKLIYFEFCMNVILIKFHSVFSLLGLKKLSNNLDQLNNLNPNIPFVFQKKYRKDDLHNETHDVVMIKKNDSTISLNQLKTVNISLPKPVANSKCNYRSSSSSSAKNFETFVFKLFSTKSSKQNSSSFSSIKLNKTTPSAFISDQNLSILQPFWSLLAVVKLIKKIPNLFQGKITQVKNNNDKYVIDFTAPNSLRLVVKSIQSTKVCIKIIDNIDYKINIKINGIEWEFFEVVDNHILIYALSPNYQYEIEVLDGEKPLNNLIINTISDTGVLRESIKVSPLSTLKYSIMSTLDNIDKIKDEIKDFKRDENRKQGEIKKNNDALRERIAKARTFYDSHSRKLRGAQQSIQQYENDVINFDIESKDVESSNKQNDEKIESLKNDINEIKSFIDNYKDSINEFNVKLRAKENEKYSFLNKLDKTVLKIKEVENDMVTFNEKIEGLKNGICMQLRKRSNSINDKFDTILVEVKTSNDLVVNEIAKFTK